MPEPTDFAPAERLPEDELQSSASLFDGTFTTAVLDALPVSVLLLSDTRQVVYCNPVFTRLAEKESMHDILGLRPGEALGCTHCQDAPGGCGTTRFCRHCGAAQAILKCLRGIPNTRECHITRHTQAGDNALDLQVFTSPISFEDHTFILFSGVDISHEKHMQIMERLFFHDLLNQVTAINYTSQNMAKLPSLEARDYSARIRAITMQISEELHAHQALVKAERGELEPKLESVSVEDCLNRVRNLAESSIHARDKQVDVLAPQTDVRISTDKTLLHRVLGNMVINALEATGPSGSITVTVEVTGGFVTFQVHNMAIMDMATKARIFKRFVSTKGPGRGLGTYGIKLLGEEVLGGMVGFVSEQGLGTTFHISLPRS